MRKVRQFKESGKAPLQQGREMRILTAAEKQMQDLQLRVQQSRVVQQHSEEQDVDQLIATGDLCLAEPLGAAEAPMLRVRASALPAATAPIAAIAKAAPAESAAVKMVPMDRSQIDFQVKQKNVQLRIDQIAALREYAYRSGKVAGQKLNESQIIRVALDLLFGVACDPGDIATEDELYRQLEGRIASWR